MGAVLTHPAAGGEVAGQVVGILGDQVPRPSNPLSPYLEALDLRRHLIEPRIDIEMVEGDGLPRTTQAQAG